MDEILNALIFENWLRFYFIPPGEDDAPVLAVPARSMAKIGELYPEYLPLAQNLNGLPVDFATSRNAILTYIRDYLDGKKLPAGRAESILASQAFQQRLQQFHTFVQLHEAQFDLGFLDFGQWLKLFDEWRRAQ